MYMVDASLAILAYKNVLYFSRSEDSLTKFIHMFLLLKKMGVSNLGNSESVDFS